MEENTANMGVKTANIGAITAKMRVIRVHQASHNFEWAAKLQCAPGADTHATPLNETE